MNLPGTTTMNAREAKYLPLTNVNHLTLRPPKVFKGEAIDITFTKDDAR